MDHGYLGKESVIVIYSAPQIGVRLDLARIRSLYISEIMVDIKLVLA
jgi:hypothetical protein